MGTGEGKRARGVGLVIAAVLSIGFVVGLVLDPTLFKAMHPLPLIGLLIVSALVAIWGAWLNLR